MKLVIDAHILAKAFCLKDRECLKLTRELKRMVEITRSPLKIPKPRQSLKIFLSYKNIDEDRIWVEDTCKQLEASGHNVWCDSIRLLGGDRWEDIIVREINDADLFFAFLSEKAVKLEGCHHWEHSIALERQRKQPEGVRYVVPLVLGDFEIPTKFKQIHGVDMAGSDCWTKLEAVIDAKVEYVAEVANREAEKNLLYLCEDKTNGKSEVCKRYRRVCSDNLKVLEKWEKEVRKSGGFIQKPNVLSEGDIKKLRSLACRDVADEVFVGIARRSKADMVSELSSSGKCLNEHTGFACPTLEYMEGTLGIEVLSVSEAINRLQKIETTV